MIYLDHAATTPLHPEARRAMEPFLAGEYGNPSSLHTAGQEARRALDEARDGIAAVLGARAEEVIFTSGGTEANNLALTGVFRATKRAIPELLARGGGAIVNTASISGLFADFAIGAYNAAKAGVINLTRVTAIEYAGRGIRVNCVCPGAIDTPLLRPSLGIPGFADTTTAMIPMRRLGRPEEIANVVLFLASDLASYVTGAALVADGGLTAQTGMPSRIPLP